MTPGRGRSLALAVAAIVASSVAAHADASVPPTGKSATAPNVWRRDPKAALDEAGRLHKRVVLLFCAEWAMPCVEMRRRVFTDPDLVATLARRFVSIYVDLTDEDAPEAKALAERNRANAIPLFLFFDRRGRETRRHVGSIEAPALQKLLAEVP